MYIVLFNYKVIVYNFSNINIYITNINFIIYINMDKIIMNN